MKRPPRPPFNDIGNLIEHSDRLIWLSEEASDRSNSLSRHFADLSTDSDQLIERSRRLGERPLGEHLKTTDRD